MVLCVEIAFFIYGFSEQQAVITCIYNAGDRDIALTHADKQVCVLKRSTRFMNVDRVSFPQCSY